jgi:uncharacterized FlaG/YvyC family protein
MDITAINRTGAMLYAPAPAVPTGKSAEQREVVQAVKAVNGAEMFSQDRELMFQRDPLTQRMVLQLINKKTKEVISQIPEEYVLRLAEDLKPRSSSAME